MAIAATETGGQVVQAYLPLRLATELRERAAGEGKSVSSTIRDAIESQLHSTSSGSSTDTANGGGSIPPRKAPVATPAWRRAND
jgi:hypothetical protein